MSKWRSEHRPAIDEYDVDAVLKFLESHEQAFEAYCPRRGTSIIWKAKVGFALVTAAVIFQTHDSPSERT